jgi:hypothetical protein
MSRGERVTKHRTAEFMLACYCEATGCYKSSVTADAVIAAINEQLRINHGVRERYEKARARLLSCSGPKLRVIKGGYG